MENKKKNLYNGDYEGLVEFLNAVLKINLGTLSIKEWCKLNGFGKKYHTVINILNYTNDKKSSAGGKWRTQYPKLAGEILSQFGYEVEKKKVITYQIHKKEIK